jgi:hypothetical protein
VADGSERWLTEVNELRLGFRFEFLIFDMFLILTLCCGIVGVETDSRHVLTCVCLCGLLARDMKSFGLAHLLFFFFCNLFIRAAGGPRPIRASPYFLRVPLGRAKKPGC